MKFRLPTEEEWTQAAQAGDSKTKTGFKKDSIRNEEGCYLLNIQPIKGRFYDDGAFFTAKVISYSPNALGFYNMLGNAAEMVSKKGVAKGGAWYSLLEDSYIDTEINFSKADPGIGFRIVMEVIEE